MYDWKGRIYSTTKWMIGYEHIYKSTLHSNTQSIYNLYDNTQIHTYYLYYPHEYNLFCKDNIDDNMWGHKRHMRGHLETPHIGWVHCTVNSIVHTSYNAPAWPQDKSIILKQLLENTKLDMYTWTCILMYVLLYYRPIVSISV